MKMKRLIALALAIVLTVGLIAPVTAVTPISLTLGQSEPVNAGVGETLSYAFTPGTGGDYVLYYDFASANGVDFRLNAPCMVSYFVGSTSYHVMDNLNSGPHKFRRFAETCARVGAEKVNLAKSFAAAKSLLRIG